MKRKTIIAVLILGTMLLSLIGTAGAVFAGSTTDETPTEVTPAVPGEKFFTHPVVQVLGQYFDRQIVDPLSTDTPTPVPTNEYGLGPIGQQIAVMHEAGWGFGVLVKLFSVAEVTCAEAADQAVCLDDLKKQIEDGGLGALIQAHKGEMLLGVGHVKHALKEMETEEACVEDTEGTECTVQDQSTKGKSEQHKPHKPNPGKGNGKGHK